MILNPQEMVGEIAERAKALRLAKNMTQADLAERIGVGVATVKRFEKEGVGSIEMLVKMAFALNAEAGFDGLFDAPMPASIDEIPEAQGRQRASGKRG